MSRSYRKAIYKDKGRRKEYCSRVFRRTNRCILNKYVRDNENHHHCWWGYTDDDLWAPHEKKGYEWEYWAHWDADDTIEEKFKLMKELIHPYDFCDYIIDFEHKNWFWTWLHSLDGKPCTRLEEHEADLRKHRRK